MRAIHDAAPGALGERGLLVMLPAAQAVPEDLVGQGFVAEIRSRGLPYDVAVVDAHADYYLEGGIGERLAADVVGPLRARGYRDLWLMGISLGAMGCLAYARGHAAEVDGVVVLAPFLGNRGVITHILETGGLARWQPATPAPHDEEQALLLWLKDYRAGDSRLPAIYLGFGEDDRYAAASVLLAQQLPRERVVTLPGGHEWQTWMRLWQVLLARNLFIVEA